MKPNFNLHEYFILPKPAEANLPERLFKQKVLILQCHFLKVTKIWKKNWSQLGKLAVLKGSYFWFHSSVFFSFVRWNVIVRLWREIKPLFQLHFQFWIWHLWIKSELNNVITDSSDFLSTSIFLFLPCKMLLSTSNSRRTSEIFLSTDQKSNASMNSVHFVYHSRLKQL